MSVTPNATQVAPNAGAAAASVSLPTADAGANQAQSTLAVVTLDGSGSSGATSYAWVLLETSKAGATTTQTGLLSDATAESPTFTPRELGAVYTAILTATNADGSQSDTTVVSVESDTEWVTVDIAAMTERDGPGVLTFDADTLTLSGNSAINSGGASDGARLTTELAVDVDDYAGIEVELTCTTYPVGGTGLRGLAVQVQDGTTQGTALGGRAFWGWLQTDSKHRLDVGGLWGSISAYSDGSATATKMVARFTWGINDGGGSREVFTICAMLYDASGEVVSNLASPIRQTWSPDVVDPEAFVLELGAQNSTGGALAFDGVGLRYRLVSAS